MGEVKDDERNFTITLAAPEVGALQIINYTFPSEIAEGKEVDGAVTVKNVGSGLAEARVKLVEVSTGKVIDKEPDTYYKNLNPGETWTVNVGTSWDPFWAMPNHDWNLRVEVWRQT